MKRKFKVFLGGATGEGNEWREALKKAKFENLELFDPYKEDWDPGKDIYRELKEMLRSDLAIFYKGGIGTKNEIEIAELARNSIVKRFNDLTELKRFLTALNRAIDKSS